MRVQLWLLSVVVLLWAALFRCFLCACIITCSPQVLSCVSALCALCCAVLCRPINDSTEPVEAQGPYEVIDADNISEYGAHRGSARVAAAGGCWSSSV
jgi:hypothetical protein